MGLDGTVLENFKKVGAKILFFPFAIMAGAFLAAALCSLLMDIDLRQSFAVTAGFGENILQKSQKKVKKVSRNRKLKL